jgi:hypothetical protein
MSAGNILFWAALFAGTLFAIVGYLGKKLGVMAVGGGMLLAVVFSLMMPDGSMWLSPW